MKPNTSINKLEKTISLYPSLAVALSGGMDSILLAFISKRILDSRMMAISVESPFSIERELNFSREFTKKHNIPHHVIYINTLDSVEIRANGPRRCYFCKKCIFSEIKKISAKSGFQSVADGTCIDDQKDYRPGKNALEELGIISPLREAGFTKSMIKDAYNHFNLTIPFSSSNACLASRIPYGTVITEENLKMISHGEDFLYELGFEPVRLRYHNEIARLELSNEGMNRLIADSSLLEKVYRKLKSIGFIYITLDMEGFRTGSMNLMLDK